MLYPSFDLNNCVLVVLRLQLVRAKTVTVIEPPIRSRTQLKSVSPLAAPAAPELLTGAIPLGLYRRIDNGNHHHVRAADDSLLH